MNASKLLEQVLGGNASALSGKASQAGSSASSALGGFGGGAAAGGLIGLLVGSKKARKMGGGLLGYGGAAAAGALAFKAYQNWQQGKQASTAPMATAQDLPQVDDRFRLPAAPAQAQDFSLTLLSAMIAAANADGHIDADEQNAIFQQADNMGLDAESKAFLFDTLRKPPALSDLASRVQGPEQASEVYLVSRLVVDGEHPAERAYLQALAHRLSLPDDLVAHLDHQVTGQ